MLHSPHLVLYIPYWCYTTSCAVTQTHLLLHNPYCCYTNTFAVTQSVLLLHNPRFSKLLICVSGQNAELTITATSTTLPAVWQERCAPTSDACVTARWRCHWEPSVVGTVSAWLQAPVYHTLPPAISSKNMSANGCLFFSFFPSWCSNSSMFVTDNSD